MAIIGNAMIAILAQFTGILFTLLGTRVLEQEALGNILIGMGVLMLASTLSSLGFPGSIPHFVTINLVKDDERAISHLLRASITILLPVCIVIASIISHNSELIAQHIYSEPSISPVLGWIAWGIPFLVLSTIFTAVLRGMNCTVRAAFIDSVLWKGVPLVFLVVLALIGAEDEMLVVQGVAITPVVMALVGFYYVATLIRKEKIFCLPMFDYEQMSYTFNSWITSIANLLRTRGDMILLGLFLSNAEVAIFAVGATLSAILLISTNIVAPAYRPMATRFIAEGRGFDLVAYHKKIVRLNLVVIGPTSVLLLFFATPIVQMLFGREYVASATVLQIMLLGIVPRAFMGPVNTTLLAFGLPNVVRRIDVATTLIFMILLVLLVPLAGLAGAALAFGGAGFIQHVWKNIEVRKHIHIPWIPSPSVIPFVSLLLIIGFAAQHISVTLLPTTFGWLIVLPIFLFLSLVSAFLVKQITSAEAKQIINLLG